MKRVKATMTRATYWKVSCTGFVVLLHLARTYEYASIFETEIRDCPLSSVLLEWIEKKTVA